MAHLKHVPELLVGFDTETTGLSVSHDRAISYGFCAFRFGRAVWSETFFVLPDVPISKGAQRIHGVSEDDLRTGSVPGPVLPFRRGIERAINLLDELHGQGAYFVGANVRHFDFEMLRRCAVAQFPNRIDRPCLNPSEIRVIDVVEVDLQLDSDRTTRPHRGLTHLCRHYGVRDGGHSALGDARAAVEVLLCQIEVCNAGQTSFELSGAPPEIRGQSN